MLFPLVTVLGTGWPSAAAWGFAAAAAGGFLAHEGLAVLLGRRGRRALRDQRRSAIRAAGVFGGIGLVAGAVAFVTSLWEARTAACGTVALAVLAMSLVRAGRERTVAGEVLVAVTLTSWCVPVGLAAGLEPAQAVGCWAVWSVTFVVATLAVRGIIARTRRDRWRAQCVAAVVLGACGWWALHRLALVGLVAEGLPLALAPAGVLSLASWVPLVRAHHLHRVGWGIVAAGVVTWALLVRAL